VAIKHRGGIAVAQDPAGALYDGMPRSAVETAAVDHVVPVDRIGALLGELARAPAAGPPPGDGGKPVNHTPGESMDARMEREADIMEMEPSELGDDARPGELSGFTCPECHGSLWEIREGDVLRYRCRVGHGYTAEAMLAEQGRDVEAALWTAFRALRERAALCRRMAQRMSARGQPALAARQQEEAAQAEQRAALLRQVLLRGPDGEAMASD
jgi:two-component system chemotaxis response regulator CheB